MCCTYQWWTSFLTFALGLGWNGEPINFFQWDHKLSIWWYGHWDTPLCPQGLPLTFPLEYFSLPTRTPFDIPPLSTPFWKPFLETPCWDSLVLFPLSQINLLGTEKDSLVLFPLSNQSWYKKGIHNMGSLYIIIPLFKQGDSFMWASPVQESIIRQPKA